MSLNAGCLSWMQWAGLDGVAVLAICTKASTLGMVFFLPAARASWAKPRSGSRYVCPTGGKNQLIFL